MEPYISWSPLRRRKLKFGIGQGLGPLLGTWSPSRRKQTRVGCSGCAAILILISLGVLWACLETLEAYAADGYPPPWCYVVSCPGCEAAH